MGLNLKMISNREIDLRCSQIAKCMYNINLMWGILNGIYEEDLNTRNPAVCNNVHLLPYSRRGTFHVVF